MLRLIATAAFILLVTGAPRAQPAAPADSPFAAVGKQYVDAFNRKDAAGVAALYTENAIMVRPAGILRGRAAIQRDREAAINAGAHDLGLRYHDYQITGDAGWSVSEYELAIRGKDGADTPVKGFASVVWVRDGGTWKIHLHTLNSSPPPRP